MTATTDDRWMNELHDLRQLRDEIHLKAHLLRSDLSDRLAELEAHWREIERDTRPVRGAVGESARGVGHATAELIGSLKQGYHRIREAMGQGGA